MASRRLMDIPATDSHSVTFHIHQSWKSIPIMIVALCLSKWREKQLKESNIAAVEKMNKTNQKRIIFTSESNSLCCTATTTEAQSGGVVDASSSQIPLIIVPDSSGIVKVAHKTRDEFLFKALGIAFDWIPIPASKLPNPTSDGPIYTCNASRGVAVHTCVVVPLEPIKIISLLQDRTSWSWDCRSQDVHAKYLTNKGECIELISTQFYAATTLALPRDFWTLRYTFPLEDGGFMVCEESISGTHDGVPSSPSTLQFVRATMMASGYLIRPVKEGSTVNIVDHVDFKAADVLEAIRPLYQSPEFVAKKMTLAALRYIVHVTREENLNSTCPHAMGPATPRSLAKALSRGFNEAMTCSPEDGWTFLPAESCSDLFISIKQVAGDPIYNGGTICIKASLSFEDIYPIKLVKLLKEHLSDWMSFNFSEHSVALSEVARFKFVFPGGNTHNLSSRPVVLGETGCEDEVLEVIRFDRIGNHTLHYSPEDIVHLQLINGLEESDNGGYSEFIFSPIERTDSDEMLSSGFRVVSLGSNTGTVTQLHSTLFLAFQFPFEIQHVDAMVEMARSYVQHIISTLKKHFIKVPATGSTSGSSAVNVTAEDTGPNNAVDLARMIVQSYRANLREDMRYFSSQDIDHYEKLEHHPHAVLCFTICSDSLCLYANQAALNMLDTTSEFRHLLEMKTLVSGLKPDALLQTLMHQGYAAIPAGLFFNVTDHIVSHGAAKAWLVHGPEGLVHSVAFAFDKWFVPLF